MYFYPEIVTVCAHNFSFFQAASSVLPLKFRQSKSRFTFQFDIFCIYLLFFFFYKKVQPRNIAFQALLLTLSIKKLKTGFFNTL